VGRILDTAIDFLSNVVPSMVPSFLQGAIHGKGKNHRTYAGLSSKHGGLYNMFEPPKSRVYLPEMMLGS